jgi:hypothetical protein
MYPPSASDGAPEVRPNWHARCTTVSMSSEMRRATWRGVDGRLVERRQNRSVAKSPTTADSQQRDRESAPAPVVKPPAVASKTPRRPTVR